MHGRVLGPEVLLHPMVSELAPGHASLPPGDGAATALRLANHLCVVVYGNITQLIKLKMFTKIYFIKLFQL